MPKYVLYHSEEECSYTFLEEGNSFNLNSLPQDAKLMWQVEAKSWEIACMKKHEYLGWEPYKPLIQSEEDLRQFIPENKHDFDNFRLLQNLGYPLIKPVLPELFEWIQDMNWPIANNISTFLAELGVKVKPQIQLILSSNDGMWKYWTITSVIGRMHLEDVKEFKPDLNHLLANLSEDDRENEVDIVALELLKKFEN